MTVSHAVATRDETPALAATAGETAAIFSMIERAARDPSIDLDRLERLFALRETMRREEAERQFNEAMSRAQAEMPRVMRDATNSHNSSRYARLETIAKAITPVITKHGFSLSFDTEPSQLAGHHRMICTVAHAAGHSRQHKADLPADAAGAQGRANKTSIQAFGSTMSYGRRYLTLLIFNVALTNEDNDGAPTEERALISEDQVTELRDLLDEVGADMGRFLATIGVESLDQIWADRLDDVKALIERKRGR